MEDIRNGFEEGRNRLRELALQIPGYGTYLERESRRDADRVLREHLCASLERSRAGLNQVRAKLAEGADLGSMGEIERVDKELARVINRLRYAPRGYTGFFARAHFDEAALDRVYEHDAGLLETVQETVRCTQELAATEGTDCKPDVAALERAIQKLDVGLDNREEVLFSLGA